MEQERLDELKKWFAEYVASFYGLNDYVNANLELKEAHSLRVCDEMKYVTEHLNLSPNQNRMAEFVALFHDIGRFVQFKKYKTYNDNRTPSHCLLSIDVLKEHRLLDSLDKSERIWIEKAIQYHGLKVLPENLSQESRLFCKLIRDADKLDIYYTVTQSYLQYRDDPENFNLELEFPDTPECSGHVVEGILNEERIDYSGLRTWNDLKLLQLSWVYDINFIPTLQRIRQRGFLELMLDFLPKTEEIEQLRRKIFAYSDARIAGAGG